MTDKQTKEGIDVSQCECYLVEDDSCNDTLSGSCMKEKCQTFRLLQTIKSKEQECEELKEDRERWKSNFNGKVSAIEELLHQIDQLKADNEELKKQIESDKGLITDAGKQIYQLVQEYDRLKADREEALKQLEFVRTLNAVEGAGIRKLSKALIEIKEIAKNGAYDEFNMPLDECSVILQIIQKCEEVDSEH